MSGRLKAKIETRKPVTWLPGFETNKGLLVLPQRTQARLRGVLADHLFDALELVVLRQPIRAAARVLTGHFAAGQLVAERLLVRSSHLKPIEIE